jgi:hypothetical protein
MVTAIALYGVSPASWRVVRGPDGGWEIESPLLDMGIARGLVHRVHDAEPTPWQRVGLCASGVSHPVVAVHRNDIGQWVPGITPGSVGEESLRLAADWFAPHALHPLRCAHDVDAAGGGGS